ncbi:MAG: hypothetical protein ACRDK9_14120 [Solirubrobacterales bacterium]
MMMRGGEGVLGERGGARRARGGETQRQGVEALADWFARIGSPG